MCRLEIIFSQINSLIMTQTRLPPAPQFLWQQYHQMKCSIGQQQVLCVHHTPEVLCLMCPFACLPDHGKNETINDVSDFLLIDSKSTCTGTQQVFFFNRSAFYSRVPIPGRFPPLIGHQEHLIFHAFIFFYLLNWALTHSHVISLKHVRNFSESAFFLESYVTCTTWIRKPKRCLMYIERCHYAAYIVHVIVLVTVKWICFS